MLGKIIIDVVVSYLVSVGVCILLVFLYWIISKFLDFINKL